MGDIIVGIGSANRDERRYPDADRILARVADGTRADRHERAAAAHLRAQIALARDLADRQGNDTANQHQQDFAIKQKLDAESPARL